MPSSSFAMAPRKSYEERLEKCNNPLLKKLFKIILEKKSNLCVAANFDTVEEIINFVDKAGQHICILKTQSLGVKGDPEETLAKLYEKKKQYNFLLFEDMKFADGDDPIRKMYSTKFVKYADLVTVMPGEVQIKAIELAAKEANLPEDEPRGCLAVCETSFAGYFPLDGTTAVATAEKNSQVCAGIIAQNLQISNPYSMIKASPGVHLDRKSDGRSQQWNHPDVVVSRGTDVVIVGRGIISVPVDELEEVTRLYKEVSYKAYLNDLNKQF